MNTIFLNSKNSKTFDPHKILLKLTYRIDLERQIDYFIKS